MRHSIGYLGHYDHFCNLTPHPREYHRHDGSLGTVDDRPNRVNGIFFGYMEREGKTFVAVRAQHDDIDIDVVLQNAVPLDPSRHTDGKGFGPKPSLFGDDSAARLVSDMITTNPQCADKLLQIANRLGMAVAT